MIPIARPILVDMDRSSYNMDPTKVAPVITRKTAAVMPVHLYGQTAEMDPILAAARDRGIPVIEDAAQAAGAEYHGKKAGNLGDTACFSFYATKNMTTGEGGMIVTDDDRIAEKARLLRHHGQPTQYEHVLVGFNYRMPLYQQKALRDLKIRGRCPVADEVIPGLFELPVHPGVGPAEIERIVAAVEEVARTD